MTDATDGNDLIRLSDSGLFCERGGFHIDPWRAVDRAVITHAHSDHARQGSAHYLSSREGEHVLRIRMGEKADIQTLEYGEAIDLNRVRLSLHPAGHVLGSAQVRIECGGKVAVVSGDYKVAHDPTCSPFEPVRCHLFVTESTFGLPVYRWPNAADVFETINAWWRSNRASGKASLLMGYSLGKAQRLLAGVDCSIGPIYVHSSVHLMIEGYRAAGIKLPRTLNVSGVGKGTDWSGALVVAPPSAWGGSWTKALGPLSPALASGWMSIRGARRRQALDRGFVLSDHADWPGLLGAIEATGAERVWVTHGYSAVLARWLCDRGVDARTVTTRFEGERDDEPESTVANSQPAEIETPSQPEIDQPDVAEDR